VKFVIRRHYQLHYAGAICWKNYPVSRLIGWLRRSINFVDEKNRQQLNCEALVAENWRWNYSFTADNNN
jgi:hypothetical protein